jgi:hypothetical protein
MAWEAVGRCSGLHLRGGLLPCMAAELSHPGSAVSWLTDSLGRAKVAVWCVSPATDAHHAGQEALLR